jgi:IS605 OrfB family transposase
MKGALAKTYRKLRRQREDFAHKLSDRLTEENRLIVFEDLKVGNVVKNHDLASAIIDASWGQPRRLTAYRRKGAGDTDEIRRSKRDAAEMLRMRRAGPERAVRADPRLSEMRV